MFGLSKIEKARKALIYWTAMGNYYMFKNGRTYESLCPYTVHLYILKLPAQRSDLVPTLAFKDEDIRRSAVGVCLQRGVMTLWMT
jgi:hypothetical protein